MEVYILNDQYQQVALIDCFQSLIWTKRYYGYGDFELYIPADEELLKYLQPDYFITRDDDDNVMLIERLQIITDAENGDYFIVSGRSLESILLRRVFSKQYITVSSSTVSDAIYFMLLECTTDQGTSLRPAGYRSLPLYVDANSFEWSTKAQFTGQTLYDAIVSILQPRGLGFKVYIYDLQNMHLGVYEGQEVPVYFSPEFDNLINSKYIYDASDTAVLAYVAGEGEGENRRMATVQEIPFAQTPVGLAYREIYVDARDISSNNGAVSAADYTNMLSARGYGKLSAHSVSKSFEAEVEPQTSFTYRTDYNLGDIVTVTNEYGVTSNPRIIEVTECWDENGYTVIPKFDALEVQ